MDTRNRRHSEAWILAAAAEYMSRFHPTFAPPKQKRPSVLSATDQAKRRKARLMAKKSKQINRRK